MSEPSVHENLTKPILMAGISYSKTIWPAVPNCSAVLEGDFVRCSFASAFSMTLSKQGSLAEFLVFGSYVYLFRAFTEGNTELFGL